MKIIIVVLLLACTSPLLSQVNTGLAIEGYGGFEYGWWVYNRGSTSSSIFNNLGWDRSDSRPTFSSGILGLYQFKNWSTGVGTDYQAFNEQFLEDFEDTSRDRELTRLSDGSVKFWRYYLYLEYHLVKKSHYTLSPSIRIGTFKTETSFEGEDNFGRKLFWQIGLSNQARLSNKLTLVIRPEYKKMLIKPKVKENFHEKHEIKSFGLSMGIRYTFKRTQI